MRALLTSRLPKDTVWLIMAYANSQRGTCARRKVGCILVDHNGHFLASGYNGPASGQPHCIDTPCLGAHQKPGEGLSACEAVHAEANALIQCKSHLSIDTAYCTDSPCMDCTKLLLNTSCRRIVFLRDYAHSEAQGRWMRDGVEDVKGGYRRREWARHPQADVILALDLVSCG